ncbi:MAG: ABC transporter substrate-binding protein [Alistipes sp.]|nr:ABC transporter substrate-binding protein [Alistipes sp.]
MRNPIRPAVFALCLALFAACSARTAALSDFDKTVYTPSCASGFEILGAEGCASTLLKVRDPWQGAEAVETALFIARDGEMAPAEFSGQVLRGPAARIVCMSSTHIALLDALGATPAIVGVSGIDFVSNAYVAAHRDAIGDVGYDSNVNYELLVALAPDLVLLYGVNGASTLEPKLRELGIPFLYIGEYLEETPLGKAEWLVAVAETVGLRDEGEQRFHDIAARYEALAARVREHLDAEAPDIVCRPRVWLNTPYQETWFIPAARSYQVRLIRDAGGDTFTAPGDGNSSQPVDLETAYLWASDADCWLHVGGCRSLAELTGRLPLFADIPAVTSGAVYDNDLRTNARGGNDYWESSVVHPDLVLRDLIRILHPELVGEEFFYYRRLE